MTGGRRIRRCILPFAMLLSIAPVTLALAPSAQAAPVGCPTAPTGLFRYAPGSGKTVALTFDDGPGKSTAQIVSILQHAHVTATFFNLGVHEQEHPDLVHLEQGAGFVLGDHTWDHQDLTTLSASQQASEIDRARVEQASLTGMYSCFLRPPGGSYNSTTLALAQQRGMTTWNWSIDTEDWKAQGSGDPYWINRIRTRAEDASIAHPVVLMHNQVVGNPATVSALPDIINFYKANHYRFVDLFGSTGLPTITNVTNARGPVGGGTRVHVYGSNFQSLVSVVFGRWAGTAVHVVTSTELLVSAPAHSAGTTDIRIVTRHGTSPVTSADHFSWIAPPTVAVIGPTTGPTAGGTRVTVIGTNFVSVTSVLFGSGVGTGIHQVTPTKLLITAPAAAAGTVQVVVKTSFGTSSGGPTFVYADPPPPPPPTTPPPPPLIATSAPAGAVQPPLATSGVAATVPLQREQGGTGSEPLVSVALLAFICTGLLVAVLRSSREN